MRQMRARAGPSLSILPILRRRPGERLMAQTAAKERIKLPGIHPSAFEHPLDGKALEALRKTPGLDLLLKKLSAVYLERMVRLAYTVNSLRLSPQQCPRIYELLRDATE